MHPLMFVDFFFTLVVTHNHCILILKTFLINLVCFCCSSSLMNGFAHAKFILNNVDLYVGIYM